MNVPRAKRGEESFHTLPVGFPTAGLHPEQSLTKGCPSLKGHLVEQVHLMAIERKK